jgi:uncharacterized membrane protein YeaQ/YmgE (transglycosylase-associated protein family)
VVEWGHGPTPGPTTARSDRAEHPEIHMGLIGTVVTVIVVGLIAGALARLLVPGRQSMSVGMTILLGIVGSFVGGFLGFLIFHKDASDGFLQPAGIIGAVIGSVIVLLIVGARGRRAVR